jgi:hypothetical protein
MSFDTNQEAGLGELQEQLRRAQAVTPDLMADVTARACPRFPAYSSAVRTRLIHLIELGAFADAALALLEIEVPGWKLRRLVYDDGEWICSLSKHCQLPDWLDDVVEAHHAILPLAILAALVEARRSGLGSGQVGPSAVPQVRSSTDYAVCCDNFA